MQTPAENDTNGKEPLEILNDQQNLHEFSTECQNPPVNTDSIDGMYVNEPNMFLDGGHLQENVDNEANRCLANSIDSFQGQMIYSQYQSFVNGSSVGLSITNQSDSLQNQTGTLSNLTVSLPIQTGALPNPTGNMNIQTGILPDLSRNLSTPTGTQPNLSTDSSLPGQTGTLPHPSETLNNQLGGVPIDELHIDLILTDGKDDKLMNSNEDIDENEDDAYEPQEDFHFILYNDLVTGKSINYKKQTFKCIHCIFWCRSKVRLCRHMKEYHSEQMSLHQDIQIKPVYSNTDHMVMKMSDYDILQSQWRRKRDETRERGTEKQDIIGEFVCPTCKKSYSRFRYLRRHLTTHFTAETFLCDECGKSFTSRPYLLAHRKTHKKKTFQCKQCDFTSVCKKAIFIHRQQHPDNCLPCNICGVAFPNKGSLEKHQRVHDSSRPFQCSYPECTWRFKTSVMCKAHIRNHSETSQGRFVCNVCQYHFKHKHHLHRHLSKIHGLSLAKNNLENPAAKNSLVQEQEETNLPANVQLIMESDIETNDIQLDIQMSQAEQLVIATDTVASASSYEVGGMAMNAPYQTFLHTAEVHCGNDESEHTILLPTVDNH